MIILNYSIDNIQNILTAIPNTDECSFIYDYLDEMISDIGRGTERLFGYDELVHFALINCTREIPSPFSPAYPACYGLNIGNDFFTLRIPNKFGFGVKVIPTKNQIKYEISLIFYNNRVFVERSSYYKDLIEKGWKVKER